LLSRDFLLAVLAGEEVDWAAVLLRAYAPIEKFLRNNHRHFLGKLGKDPNTIYTDCGIPREKWKALTLVDLLQVCSRALKGGEYDRQIGSNWSEFTEARNHAVHNNEQLSDWRGMLLGVLASWSRANLLISLIEKRCGIQFTSKYREDL
jgi:hypothetical protein